MPMSKRNRVLLATAKVVRGHPLTSDQVSAMDAAAIDDSLFPSDGRGPDPARLQPDMASAIPRRDGAGKALLPDPRRGRQAQDRPRAHKPLLRHG